MSVELAFEHFAEWVAVSVEVAAVLLIAVGALEALWTIFRPGGALRSPEHRLAVWRRLGAWLLLALELELGADIVRTAISPSWSDIGQLGAIAVIRTFLSYFLARDMKEAAEVSHARAG